LPVCKRCNQLKGKLIPEQYKELLKFLDHFTGRSEVENRLLHAQGGFQMRRGKKEPQPFIEPPREQQKVLRVPDRNGDPTF
jgi:uncharacterized protein YbgA (DUF1722 family)